MKSMDKLTTGVAYGTSAGSAGYLSIRRFRHERDVVFLHRFREPFCHSITLRTADYP